MIKTIVNIGLEPLTSWQKNSSFLLVEEWIAALELYTQKKGLLSSIMHVILAQSKKKGLLLFDYACHSCSETMLIFSVF